MGSVDICISMNHYIQFYEGDGDEGSDGTFGDEFDSDSGGIDAGLTPLQKLEKYLNSEHSYSRQLISRTLLEAIKSLQLPEQSSDAEKVLKAMVQMSEDLDSTVRMEMVEQVLAIATHLRDFLPAECNSLISTYLQPIVVKFLVDTNTQVRKSCHAAFLGLLQENLVSEVDIEHQVIPTVLDLTSSDSQEDFRTEACLLLCKMAVLLGSEVTEKYLLQRFSELCTDALFHVRKVCALNIGDVCKVVGQENTETKLLSKFQYLCEDGVWGVRNACAECFSQVSSVCSSKTRHDELSQVFIGLICDQSRWVRMAAFQALGSFISTFADSNVTGMEISEDGSVVVVKQTNEESSKIQTTEAGKNTSISSSQQSLTCKHLDPSRTEPSKPLSPNSLRCGPCLGRQKAVTGDEDDNPSCSEALVSELLPAGSVVLPGAELHAAEETEYSSFNYWRVPVIDINVIDSESHSPDNSSGTASQNHLTSESSAQGDTSVISPDVQDSTDSKVNADEDMKDTSTSVDEVVLEEEGHSRCEDAAVLDSVDDLEVQSFMDVQEPSVDNVKRSKVISSTIDSKVKRAVEQIVPSQVCRNLFYAEVQQCGTPGMQTVEELKTSSVKTVDTSSEADSEPSNTDSCTQQTVIPKELLDHYLSMTDPQRAQTVDTDILQHCAYSLPAVAYTLGRNNWSCIRNLYETLARDMQWKVRRTLAFSLHKLAVILGESITTVDLVPVFDEFLKDLDEVRIGILMYLSDFLKLLSADVRQSYLVKLPEFLKTDNSRNWRFRKSLAEQMVPLMELFSSDDVIEHLTPMAFSLADDKVSQVRLASLAVLSAILRHVSSDEQLNHWTDIKTQIIENFAKSDVWCRRQLFAQLCDYLFDDSSLSVERLCQEFLPHLLELENDRVPNCRLILARVLVRPPHRNEYLRSSKNVHHESVEAILIRLARDSDSDVRRTIHAVMPHLAESINNDSSADQSANDIESGNPVTSSSNQEASLNTAANQEATLSTSSYQEASSNTAANDSSPVAGVTLTDEISPETDASTA